MPDAPDLQVLAPFSGTVIAIARGADEAVSAGAAVIVLEAMKMEHEVLAERDGVVRALEVAVGDAVQEGQLLAVLAPGDGGQPREAAENAAADDGTRPDLEAVRERHELGLDAARPEAVKRRRDRDRRTARENLAELVDEDTFVEYGPLMFAAQEQRRSKQELIERTPADGLVGGVGDIDGQPCVVMSYDYTVLAGTQGNAQPPEEGPAVRARRAAPAAGGAVRRGRRRAPGRCRHADRGRA